MQLEDLIERLSANGTLHSDDRCAGQYCTIHNPSDHHMRDWPVVLRRSGLIERLCADHEIGHPDPDSWPALDKLAKARWGEDAGGYDVHSCDGCCFNGGS